MSDYIYNSFNSISIRYNNYTNTWTIYNKQADNSNLKVTTEFGTSRKNAYEIMEDSLNLQNCVVRDRHDDGERVWYTVNSEETAKAQEKQAVLREKFSEWVMEHPDIILIDEPTNALDSKGVDMVKRVLQREKARGALIVLTCHDYSILKELSDNIYFIEEGRIVDHEK